MPRDRGDAAYLLDMVEAAERAVRYVAGKTRDDYDRDEVLRDAVERRIEIIGEAARGLSEAFCAAHPEIPWRKIRATRHILAHDYNIVNDDIMWEVVTRHLPELLGQLRPLIPAPPTDPEPEP